MEWRCLKEDGFILIITLVLLLGILILGISLADHLLIQNRIQQNLYLELKTDYLGQAGMQYATNRLKWEPTWRPQDYWIDSNSDGKIQIQIFEDDSAIIVHSTGVYQNFRKEVIGFFSKEIPIIRFK